MMRNLEKKKQKENLIFLPITMNACRRINKANRKVQIQATKKN